jgi:hypothetical protein
LEEPKVNFTPSAKRIHLLMDGRDKTKLKTSCKKTRKIITICRCVC